MKKLLLVPLFLALVVGAKAQKSKDKGPAKVDTTLTANIDYLPLYGSKQKSEAKLSEEKAFLEDADKNFANRSEASKFFEARAWEYVQENRLDTATSRFNLAWLLDKKNINTYWGLGLVCTAKGKADEAIHLFQQGLAIDPKDENLTLDLSASYFNRYKLKGDKRDFKSAVEVLEKGIAQAPKNANMMVSLASLYIDRYKQKPSKKDMALIMDNLNKAVQVDSASASAYAKLSLAYYLQEDYDKAWEAFHKGRELSMSSIDFKYLTDLMAKKQDPKGLFK